jgi:hypothetical protein
VTSAHHHRDGPEDQRQRAPKSMPTIAGVPRRLAQGTSWTAEINLRRSVDPGESVRHASGRLNIQPRQPPIDHAHKVGRTQGEDDGIHDLDQL